MKLLEEAKASISIPEAWQNLGLTGEPRKSCRSPFRDDHKPSFSIFDDGRRWRDHATGEGGDVIDFVAMALNVSLSEAAKWVINQTRQGKFPRDLPPIKKIASEQPKPDLRSRKPLQHVKLDNGTYSEPLAIQEARKLPMKEPLEILTHRGLLKCGTFNDGTTPCRAWIITDAAQCNAQARRMDGLPWESIGKKKAKTLPGSHAAWPIGLTDAVDREQIFFVEGGPDLLAAAHLAYSMGSRELLNIGFACMIGASLAIPHEALPAFQGKTVRIFAHHDKAGFAAARKWRDQLTTAGATVTVLCSEIEGRDLNDVISAGEAIILG